MVGMPEPKIPKKMEGTKGLAKLIKYLIELRIYREVKEGNGPVK